MNAKLSVPFLVGLVLFPGFILIHELGHYVAGWYFGLETSLHYNSTTYTGTAAQLTPHVNLMGTMAGPLVDAVQMIIGVAWLWMLRRHRRTSPATFLDWIATALALHAGRWLRGFAGSPSNPQPEDEAFISQALGLPAWLLPYCLAVMAVVMLTAIVRQHAVGQRLIPFSAIMLGGCIGCALWMWLLGPLILP